MRHIPFNQRFIGTLIEVNEFLRPITVKIFEHEHGFMCRSCFVYVKLNGLQRFGLQSDFH